jgi:hypothetical protein
MAEFLTQCGSTVHEQMVTRVRLALVQRKEESNFLDERLHALYEHVFFEQNITLLWTPDPRAYMPGYYI